MKRIILTIGAVAALAVLVLGINRFFAVWKAHSSFANYYAFRGCTKLLKKTDSYAVCIIPSGKIIKLVHVSGKWYLDGDLPVCYFNFCF